MSANFIYTSFPNLQTTINGNNLCLQTPQRIPIIRHLQLSPSKISPIINKNSTIIEQNNESFRNKLKNIENKIIKNENFFGKALIQDSKIINESNSCLITKIMYVNFFFFKY